MAALSEGWVTPQVASRSTGLHLACLGSTNANFWISRELGKSGTAKMAAGAHIELYSLFRNLWVMSQRLVFLYSLWFKLQCSSAHSTQDSR